MQPVESNPIIDEDLRRITAAALPWNDLAGKTVMVSGGGGFLASYLVKSLLLTSRSKGLGLRVLCVVRNEVGASRRLASILGSQDFQLVRQDLTRPLESNFPSADLIVHAASQASPKFYGVDPVGTLMANTAGTASLLNHAVASRASRFLFFSSGEVYGVPIDSSKPTGETDYGYLDPINVRSCYGEGKRVGETMCAAWAAQYGLHASVVRPFHTYGPGIALDDGRVFADFVADVVHRRDIVLKSDGSALRPFCYIADATIGFLTVLLRGAAGQAYNVGNPAAEVSMRDLAHTVAALYPERGVQVRFENADQGKSYLKSPIARSCPDIGKIAALGWIPEIGVAEGFRRTIDATLAEGEFV